MQTRTQSIIEVTANYTLGFILAWLINRYVLHWMGYRITAGETTGITLIFTVVSIIRSYAVRRLFNWVHRPKPIITVTLTEEDPEYYDPKY